jgi:hypothetical protein
VVGKTSTVTIGANDPIVPAFFAAQPLAAQSSTGAAGTVPVSLEGAITKGYVALAIPSAGTGTGATGDLTAAGFYILPGDHIDILIDPGTTGSAGVRYSFQDVPVLRVGVSGSTGAPSVYMVEVPRAQSELLTALITATGPQTIVKYVLRPQSEWGKVAPDNSSYTPNYEDNTAGPQLPTAKDTTVNAGPLSRVCGG